MSSSLIKDIVSSGANTVLSLKGWGEYYIENPKELRLLILLPLSINKNMKFKMFPFLSPTKNNHSTVCCTSFLSYFCLSFPFSVSVMCVCTYTHTTHTQVTSFYIHQSETVDIVQYVYILVDINLQYFKNSCITFHSVYHNFSQCPTYGHLVYFFEFYYKHCCNKNPYV